MTGGTMQGADSRPYIPEGFDEALDADGRPRGPYADLLPALESLDMSDAGAQIQEHLDEQGVIFKGDEQAEVLHLDVVPRVLGATEWEEIERGLSQRARALDAFIRDAYTEQLIVREGVVPARVIETAEYFEAEMVGVEVHGPWAAVIGFDLVRGSDGNFRVLEDNCKTPSGIAYALAARSTLDTYVPLQPPAERRDIAYAIELLSELIRNAAPDGGGDPRAALISEGDENSAWYEHRTLADRLGIQHLKPDELEVRGDRLYGAPSGERPVEIQVIYRRNNVSKLRDSEGDPTWLHQLLEPVRRGNLSVITPFGAGVGDDKLTHAYSERLIDFYLGEKPIIEPVRSYDLADREAREEAFDRVDELVFKPRAKLGGRGVMIGERADEEEREEAIERARDKPEDFIAQETVQLSTHPTFCGGSLRPRHIDLRAFAYGDAVPPGGLTRVALERGDLIVNTSQGGGAKDTWVLS